jgi:hypothetical protein
LDTDWLKFTNRKDLRNNKSAVRLKNGVQVPQINVWKKREIGIIGKSVDGGEENTGFANNDETD